MQLNKNKMKHSFNGFARAVKTITTALLVCTTSQSEAASITSLRKATTELEFKGTDDNESLFVTPPENIERAKDIYEDTDTLKIKPMKGIEYLGLGYDAMKGNPEGDSRFSGADPGFREPVIELVYDTNSRSRDSAFLIPKGSYVAQEHACQNTETSLSTSTLSDYAESLEKDATIKGTYLPGKFSFSNAYNEFNREVSSQKRERFKLVSYCIRAQVGFFRAANLETTSFFNKSVQQLPKVIEHSHHSLCKTNNCSDFIMIEHSSDGPIHWLAPINKTGDVGIVTERPKGIWLINGNFIHWVNYEDTINNSLGNTLVLTICKSMNDANIYEKTGLCIKPKLNNWKSTTNWIENGWVKDSKWRSRMNQQMGDRYWINLATEEVKYDSTLDHRANLGEQLWFYSVDTGVIHSQSMIFLHGKDELKSSGKITNKMVNCLKHEKPPVITVKCVDNTCTPYVAPHTRGSRRQKPQVWTPNIVSSTTTRKWQDFWDEFGTHYLDSSRLGGKMEVTVSNSLKKTFENSSTELKVALEGKVGPYGGSVDASLKNETELQRSLSEVDRNKKSYVVGGTPPQKQSTGFGEWAKTVSQFPMPVRSTFNMFSDLQIFKLLKKSEDYKVMLHRYSTQTHENFIEKAEAYAQDIAKDTYIAKLELGEDICSDRVQEKRNKLRNNNGSCELIVEKDGDIQLSSVVSSKLLWHSNSDNTFFQNDNNIPWCLKISADGNLILYDFDEKDIRWDSETSNTSSTGGQTLYLQNDCNLVIRDKNMNAVWATMSSVSTKSDYGEDGCDKKCLENMGINL